MLIMTLFLLGIGFIQHIIDLLVDVLDAFNISGGFINLRLNLCKLFLCGHKRHYDVNGTQWLKYHAHLKGVMGGRAMESSIVVLHIGKTLVSCLWMLGVVHM